MNPFNCIVLGNGDHSEMWNRKRLWLGIQQELYEGNETGNLHLWPSRLRS